MKKYATLRPLIQGRTRDVRKGLEKMLGSLKGFEGEARIQFRIVDKQVEHWVLEVSPVQKAVRKVKLENPDFELLTRKETWTAIASGRLSPAEAFLQGEMRVRGNVELGRRVFERLAAPGGTLEIC